VLRVLSDDLSPFKRDCVTMLIKLKYSMRARYAFNTLTPFGKIQASERKKKVEVCKASEMDLYSSEKETILIYLFVIERMFLTTRVKRFRTERQ